MKDCRIFINYRRKDCMDSVKQFYKLLKKIYGDVIFLDDPKVRYGDKFENKITPGVVNCSLFLACIGYNWDRRRYLNRLKNKDDWVRREMELAKDNGKPIVPILFNRDELPAVDKLPPSLQQGIFDRKGYRMDEDSACWEDNIRRVHPEIETYTNLRPKKVAVAGSEDKYINTICRLDRSKQCSRLG